MDVRKRTDHSVGKAGVTVERTSERELVVTRTVGGPARIVFEAWIKPELFKRWWAPKSFGVSLISYEADVRTGGDVPSGDGPPFLGAADGVLRSIHRSNAVLPPRLDE